MAIGSPDKAARLDQLRALARCQVWSGYRGDEQIRAELYEAVLDEERDARRAAALTEELMATARQQLAEASISWPEQTSFDLLQKAFTEIRQEDVIVLEAVNDHWDAAEALQKLAAEGRRPRGIAYFTHPDIWHAVEHGMLELNLWHGDSANVAPGDDLLDLVLAALTTHGIPSCFDEGRIEATLEWQRRISSGG